MTTVDLDRISAEAREVHPGRALLAVVAALFYAIGWTARKSLLAVAWAASAVRIGWTDAGPQRAPEPGGAYRR